MEEALTAFIGEAAAVVALVGVRITWGERAQGAPLGAIVLHRISGVPEYADDGESGLIQSRIQADCLGETKSAATAIARALKAAVSGKSFERGGIEFQTIDIEDERSDFGLGVAKERIHRTIVDLLIWHSP